MGIDWGAVWEFLAPILREALIAFLMALLALLGYDQVVPSRFERLDQVRKIKSLGLSMPEVSRRHDGPGAGGAGVQGASRCAPTGATGSRRGKEDA